MINYRGLSIPRTALGANITTDNLFDPNEQVIFDFYAANPDRYRCVADIGANVGVHSILMARQMWFVYAYEPDPIHFDLLRQNIRNHQVLSLVCPTRAAVSDKSGYAQFVRVLDNTTGSHLSGAKDSYGPQERIEVPVVDCRGIFSLVDFAKIDCEGHEAVLIKTTTAETWARMDALLEVGSNSNAWEIWNHLRDVVPMWAQKIKWRRVRGMADMPQHHSEGSLFIGVKPPFLKWG